MRRPAFVLATGSGLGEQRVAAVATEQSSAHFVQQGLRRHWPQQADHPAGRGFAESQTGYGH